MTNTGNGSAAEGRRVDDILLKMAIAKLQHFSADIAKLRAEVAELKGLTAAALSRRVPSTVDIDADAVGPFERGFYAREFDPQGRPFRWTGDGEVVELRFFINRNVANRFSLTGYLSEGASIGAVRAFVDYSAVPLDISRDGNRIVLSGELPPVALETRASLTLWAPDGVAPRVADGRTLWFIFSRLAVHPVEAAADTVAPALVGRKNGAVDPEESDGMAAAPGPFEGEGILATSAPAAEAGPLAAGAEGGGALQQRSTPGRRSRKAESRR